MSVIWTHIDKFRQNKLRIKDGETIKPWRLRMVNEKFKKKFVGCLSDRSKIFNKFPIKLEQEFIFFNSE